MKLVATAIALALVAQTPTPFAPLPHPRGYVAMRAAAPPVIDGRLDDSVWVSAAWTEDFVDIEGGTKPAPLLRTRAKLAWDDKYLYVGAELSEPNLWATIYQHDAVIFKDHDFEVFVDPDGDSHEYYEFEINARGAFWDLFLPQPYREGGHAVDSFEMTGVRAAVALDGTLNDPRDTDRGWSVEIAFPWSAFSRDQRAPSVPRVGAQWRVNFSRVEWTLDVKDNAYVPRPNVPEANWVWSPQHVVDMHRPERWGYVQFASAPAAFVPDPAWGAKQWLQAVHEAQRTYCTRTGRYAATLAELGVAAPADHSLSAPTLAVTPSLYEATITLTQAGQPAVVWHIRQDAKVWRDAPK